MHRARVNYIRLVFAVTALAIIALFLFAVLQRQNTGNMAGKWVLTAIGGVKVSSGPGEAEQDIDITDNDTFSWPSLSISGTWKVNGTNLLLHPEKYDGKTPEQFRAETQAKFASDPSMQKIASKVFEDLKLSIGADYATISLDLGGTVQTFTRKTAK